MADIFDEIAGAVQPSVGPELPKEDIFDHVAATVRPDPTGAIPVLGKIGNGLSQGWLNELQGLAEAGGNEVANLFGGGNEKPFWENYKNTRNYFDDIDERYRKANPGTSFALELLGGAAPALISGGGSLLTGQATKAAPGLLGSVAKSLFGVGMEEAPTLFNLAKMGATQGAVYGAGEAGEGNRLLGGIMGGGVGAVAAPIVGKTLEYGVNSVADALANRGILGAGNSLLSERGSFSLNPAGTSYRPEEVLLAKQLKNTPMAKISGAIDELDQAISNDIPLFLPEAVGSPKVDRNARFIANYEPSLEYSQTQIGNRTAGAESRANSLFNIISKKTSPYEGASQMGKAADDIISTAEAARGKDAGKIYQAAYDQSPLVTDPKLQILLEKDKVLSSTITNLKKTANNADLADNSTELLVKARGRIYDKIEDLKSKGQYSEARDLQDTYVRLNKILQSNETLAAADAVYSKASQGIDALNSTFLKNLSNFSSDKIQSISQVFNLSPERISLLKGVFQQSGKIDEWNAGIRSYLQSTVESTKTGRNFTDKLTGNTVQKAKLEAALGDSYESVAKGLSYENRMFEGKNKYHAGSSTEGNFSERAEFERGVGLISKFASGDYKGAITSLFNGNMPDEVAQGLSKIYFDPKKGHESLKKIMPLLEQYAKNKSFSRVAGSTTGGASAKETGDYFGTTINKFRSNAKGGISTSGLDDLINRLKTIEAGSASDAKSSTGGQLLGKAENLGSAAEYSSGPGNLRNQETSLFNIPSNSDLSQIQSSEGQNMYAKQPVSQVIEAVKQDPIDEAIMLTESNGDPKAKNPNSSASGLFQLINSTAKNLGVKDVFDAGDNYDGYLKLKAENVARFGDEPATVYAAHFLGAPLLQKYLDGKTLSGQEESLVRELKSKALPRFMKIYSKVIKAKTGQVEA